MLDKLLFFVFGFCGQVGGAVVAKVTRKSEKKPEAAVKTPRISSKTNAVAGICCVQEQSEGKSVDRRAKADESCECWPVMRRCGLTA